MSFRFPGLPALTLLLATAPAFAVHQAQAQIGVGIGIGIGFHVSIAPPALPIYVQPPLPAPGYIWTPGYWSYGDYGYYWVPGTWVQPPTVGLLWTPGYWGWHGGYYGYNAGYWGAHVGFYGGINYGFGYTGSGFYGGGWRGGVFSYNRAYNNFGGVHVNNVYNQSVVVNRTVNNVSYNGPGGVTAQPSPQEQAFAHEPHTPPTQTQAQHIQTAAANPALRQSVNHGAPAIAATQRPGEFHGPNVVPAHAAAAPEHAAAASPQHPAAATPVHPAVAGAAIHPPAGPPARTAMPKVAHPSSPVHNAYASANRPAVAHQASFERSGAAKAPHPSEAPRPAPSRPHPAAPHPPASHGAGEKHK